MRTTRAQLLLVSALAAALLTSCAADPEQGRSIPTPSPTFSATPTEDPGVAVPVRQVPLECEEISPPTADLLGYELEPKTWFDESGFDVAIALQDGQRFCSWEYGSRDAGAVFAAASVVVSRDAQLRLVHRDPGEPPLRADGPLFGDVSWALCTEIPVSPQFGCTWEMVVGDYHVSTHIFGNGDPRPLASSVESALPGWSEHIGTLLASRDVPARWSAPADALPASADCSLFTGVDMTGVLGVPSGQVVDTTGQTPDHTEPLEVATIGGALSCTWAPAEGEGGWVVEARILRGGGWYWDDADLTAGGRSIDIQGADDAAVVCRTDLPCVVEMRVGVDAVRVRGGAIYAPFLGSEEQLVAAAQEVAAALAA